ncbi:WD40-repeat-containing domain protein, partial [Powellomyces hirtus]
LPSHLAFFILQHLPVEDVVNCCRVCRTWNREALNPILWQRFCMDAGILFGPGIEHILLERCGDDTLLWWKEVYRDGITRRRNWERGKYELLTVPLVDIRDSINCFWFDGDKMVIGTRRHRLSVFHIPSPSTWTTLAARDDPKPVTPDVTFHPGHSVPIMAIGLPDQAGPVSHLLASVDGSGALILWNVFTGAIIANVPTAHNGGIAGVAIIDSGRRIVTAGFDRILRVHEIRLDEEQEEPDEAPGPLPDDQSSQGSSSGVSRTGSISSAANAGKQLLGTSFGVQSGDTASVMSRTSSLRTGHTASISGSLPRDASIRSGKSIRDSPSASSRRRANHSDPGRPPSGKKRDFAAPQYSIVCTQAIKGHSGDIYCMAVMPDENIAVTGSMDHTVKVWDLEANAMARSMRGHTDSVTCLCVRDEYVFSGSLDKTIRQWDTTSGRCTRTLMGHTKWVKTMAVDDRMLISGGWDEVILVWDWKQGTLLHSLPINHGPIVCLQFDETKIAAVCRGDGYQHHITILDFGSKRIEPLVVKSEQEEQEKSVSQRVLADPEAAEKEGGEEVPVAG